MMITQVQRELIALAPQVYQTASDKGFWSEGKERNKGEMVMLMISELGEAQEAHRKKNIYWPDTRLRNRNVPPKDGWAFDIIESNPEAWGNWFRSEVKDSVQDEMADVVIRILDYVFGWGIRVIEREYRKESTGNFSNDLLRINWYLLLAYHAHTDETGQFPGKDFGYALAAICKFCEWWSIDLLQHVEWKMRYNSTREHMHGKAY